MLHDFTVENNAGKKKKRNRPKKKNPTPDGIKIPIAKGQTEPPTIPIIDLFPDGKKNIFHLVTFGSTNMFVFTKGNFPVGEEVDYPSVADDRTAKDRFSSEEKKALDRSQLDMYNEVRCAAEAHRQVQLTFHYVNLI